MSVQPLDSPDLPGAARVLRGSSQLKFEAEWAQAGCIDAQRLHAGTGLIVRYREDHGVVIN